MYQIPREVITCNRLEECSRWNNWVPRALTDTRKHQFAFSCCRVSLSTLFRIWLSSVASGGSVMSDDQVKPLVAKSTQSTKDYFFFYIYYETPKAQGCQARKFELIKLYFLIYIYICTWEKFLVFIRAWRLDLSPLLQMDSQIELESPIPCMLAWQKSCPSYQITVWNGCSCYVSLCNFYESSRRFERISKRRLRSSVGYGNEDC